MPLSQDDQLSQCLERLQATSLSPFELLSSRNLPEKLIELVIQGVPAGPPWIRAGLRALTTALAARDTSGVKVVVFGGGTGLSTIIGGDSLSLGWLEHPFHGLKAVFPQTTAVVCVTDDGGSTGELLKDFPLIGLGDIRHVMLSAVQKLRLQADYRLSEAEVNQVGAALFALFNHRFDQRPSGPDDLLRAGSHDLCGLPEAMAIGISRLVKRLFADPRLAKALQRPHCLGNLLLASAIYGQVADDGLAVSPLAIRDGLREVAALIGVAPDAVLPCTCTPSTLKIRYANGVVTSGESKSASARRGVPIAEVVVDFCGRPQVLAEVGEAIRQADIILLAPGSLYTSIAPIMQVPGLAEAIRENRQAIKLLVANLWAQAGETDRAIADPARRFYVSDLISAYHRNIPGGVCGLFSQVLLPAMGEIPGNILQSYAIEGKTPIYLDRMKVWKMGFLPIEAAIFSREGLTDHKVRHDPQALAAAVKTLWVGRDYLADPGPSEADPLPPAPMVMGREFGGEALSQRYARLLAGLAAIEVGERQRIADILWRHADIPVRHLATVRGVVLVPPAAWLRGQVWDNLPSFYDPTDGVIKIRQDWRDARRFEVAFLVALGQSLLGNYALRKDLEPLLWEGETVGKVYHLTLRPEAERETYFTPAELARFLALARMRQSSRDAAHFSRVVNGTEGFTPPGLLFGLTYAWYLDNRFAGHIEAKMAIVRAEVSDLIPEQVKNQIQRRALIDFFREVVFGPPGRGR